jgi:hypothetical protein
MTRAPGWIGFAGMAAIAVIVLVVLWVKDLRDAERDREFPLVVVARETTLRRGNADAYPPRLGSRLPRGVEARKLNERGGWIQVRLAGGAIGWLPAFAIVSNVGRS